MQIKRQILALFILCSSAIGTNAQTTELHHRVQVNTDAAGIKLMASKGIAVDHGIVKKGTYFISDFSDSELALIQSLGLSYEVQIEDVGNYYATRNREDLAGKPRAENACVNCKDYTTPENFNYGSVAGFYTLQEMLNILDSMHVKYPNLITAKTQIGLSEEGRPIYSVRMSNNPNVDQLDKPEVLYTALHHAREVQSLSQLVFYMWYLLENYGSNAEVDHLLNNRELYFVPCVNPDGYVYNQTTNPSGGGMWRKNRKNNGSTFGVDLNRNYDSYWGYDNTGSSPNGSSETYRGTGAFSEKETQTIRDFCNSRDFKIALNAHTYSNLLIYPYSHIPNLLTPDSATFHCLAEEMAACSGFIIGTPNQTVGYSTNGDSDGWMYDEQVSKDKIYALTPEAGSQSDGFWPLQSRIIPISKNTMQQNLSAAWLAGVQAEVVPMISPSLNTINAHIPFEFKRKGIENGTFNITISPVTPNFSTTGSITINNPVIDSVYKDSIPVMLVANIANNETIKFAMTWHHQSGDSWTDTFTTYYTVNELALHSDGNSLNEFTGTGWGISTNEFTSATGSISESPNGASYANNANKNLVTTNWIDLTEATNAILTFDAKWDIEKGYDYAAIQVQEESGTWITMCGVYTTNGTSNQGNQPVYDGKSKGWQHERMDLQQFAGKKIKIRVVFRSDGGVNGDGFTFDEMKVNISRASGSSVSTPGIADINLSNSPNPCSKETQIHYSLKNNISDARLVIRDITGSVILNSKIDASTSHFNVDLKSFSEGMYFYRIESGSKFSTTKKMVVIK